MTDKKQYALKVQGAIKHFGNLQALDQVGLELKKGERLALLGPNGAGKTTMIRAIAGRLKLNQGDIQLNGSLGVIPQEIALYPMLTAYENMQAFGKMSGTPKSGLKNRIRELLEWIGLEDRAHDLVSTFSGGMKRRLNIACSLIHKPSVVLLDEPTVGVDPQSRQKIWEMLEELSHSDTSLVVTTHMLDEAEKVCDRILILDHGKLIAQGTLDELILNTIGSKKKVVLTTKQTAESIPAKVGSYKLEKLKEFKIRAEIDHVSDDLPNLLLHLKQAGLAVEDVQIKPPTLHAVFIHLTGRELRDA
ncbi:MAG: multidrug ABC transporter ATP-binding protein [Acidobacteria bacterium]|nr:MAG: multidrug ABC transporter ATP-binding protein [Acidobacteriota bacterium]PIE89621.1 MAG: multidrug ABC transporter ATP-binding protein [Acidobacteriota bacterium]